MAKLVRQKSTAQLGPVGVVRMTGLRSQAEAWGETGRAADKLTNVFTRELTAESKRRANEEFADYVNNPETNLHGAVRKNAKGEAIYVADADGVPTELPPNLQQKKLKDEGIFSGAYTEEINRLAREHNKNLAINNMRSYLSGQYALQESSKKWDPALFNANGTAYIQETIKSVSPAVQAEVFNDATSRLSVFFNTIQQQAYLKTQEDAIASKERRVDQVTGEVRDSIANTALGLTYDSGLQRQLATAFQEELDLSQSKGEDAIARGKRIDAFNMTIANGQIQNQVTMMASDETGFTAEDNLEMSRYLDGLISGQSKITGAFVNSETNEIEVREGTIGEMIPNLDDRQRLFANLGGVIKTKRDIWEAEEKFYENTQLEILRGLRSQLYLAAESGDVSAISNVQNQINEWQQGLKGNKANELREKGAYSMLWAKKQLASEYSDVISEGYAKGLATLNNELIQQLSSAQSNLYTEQFRIGDEEFQQALKDKGWDAVYADQKKKYQVLTSMLAANKPSKSQQEYEGLIRNPDATGKQTKKLGDVAASAANLVAGGEYKPLQADSQGLISWQNDWQIIGPAVTSTGIIPSQLRERITNAFQNRDAMAIVNGARLVMEMRDKGVPLENIKSALGDDAHIALTQVMKDLTMTSEMALSEETLDRALTYYNQETRPLMKWDATLKREFDAKMDTAHESILPFGLGDESPYPPKMKADLTARAKIAIEKGEATTAGEAFDIAYDDVIKTRRIWGESKYGVSDTWNKYPIEQAYKGFTGKQLNAHIRQSMLDFAGNMVRIGTGEEVNLLTDFALPAAEDVNGEFGYMEDLRQEQIASGKGYKLAFTHVRGTGPTSVYRANVRAADGSLQPMYTTDGREVEVDISKTYGIFNQGKDAMRVIDAQIEDLQTKYEYLDNYPLHLGSVAAPGYASNERLKKVQEWQEVQQDIAALQDIRTRLDRATDIVDDEVIMQYAGKNVITEIQKIRNEITSMPVDEYNKFDALDREGKLQWMRDRGLLME